MKKIVLIFLLFSAALAQADDGVYQISSTCANFGCFPGDASGYPITISSPGSYVLTSNLVSGLENTNIIRITSNNVTIDMNGFSIIGPRTCTGFGVSIALGCDHPGMTADGISAPNSVHSIVIKNGMIKGMDSGIAILGGVDNSNMVINVIAEENEEGILIASGIIKDSQANRNALRGFGSTQTGNRNGHLTITDSAAFGNGVYSAVATVCSNVFFKENGINSTSGDEKCAYYTNGSVCKETACL